MNRSVWFSSACWRVSAALSLAVMALSTPPANAQSVVDRPPNMHGTWVGTSGTAYFNFMHRFQAGDAPQRDVQNTPTFLLAAGLPGNLLVGFLYATSSPWVRGFPNEWEFFGRYTPGLQSGGWPADLSLTAAYNQAADSFDGQIALARRMGPLRVIGAARGFSQAFRRSSARAAVAGGATFRLTESIALAGDVATLLDREDSEKLAWSAGLQLLIPTTPHTLSLHASNSHTTTLQGASIGGNSTLWGFEFTIPITLSRYFGRRTSTAAVEPVRETAVDGGAVEIRMGNLTFEPANIEIQVGDTVRWRNTSTLIHTATADPARAANAANVSLPEGAATFDSGEVSPGETFTYVFDVPGSYSYICVPHEMAGMLGTIIVTR